MKIILSFAFILFLFNFVEAQIEEVGATTQGNENITGYKYRFTSQVDDTISIKIIDPRGELMSVPVQDRTILAAQSVPFRFQTRFWRPGQYQIIVESKKESSFVKRFQLDASGKKTNN
ncbi:MAG: hypothetical protein KDC80_16945 [Saprospiraceae bacterium]|nr:hypothetical protein [Saprospiraceae bacterium]